MPIPASADALAAASLADVAPLAAVVTAMAAAATEAPVATRRSRRAGRVGQTPAPAAAPTERAAGPAPVPATERGSAEPFELLEPDVDAVFDVEDESADAPDPLFVSPDAASRLTAEEADAFEAAARLFSFTGETPVQTPAAGGSGTSDHAGTPHIVASRHRRVVSFKRLTATSFSVGVMGIVGLLTVSMTVPAAAVAGTGTADITASVVAHANTDHEEIQAYVAPSGIQSAAIERHETYSTVTMAQLASESGIRNFSNFFVNDPNSPIQWPFAVGVPISYGFGVRSGSMHEGADFTPGEGSPIQAIADGVVRESTDSGGAFGVHIVIDHIIDGQLISSSYSHMLYGSRQVQVGDHVTVGTIVGHTGDTGRSFGAHTHFEILVNGTTPIDPIPWLRQHAGG
ncbi:M23 family metallopeptidase [Microbacterium sp. zg.B48]|uniref:M23 family metallopeptidase n=1 Tax=Microbacterium sp. zg.B48 TaxID=2969408 RepID=UPI00214B35F4|nr:M23 family metallopeptidase [Microbacterium sp. zg.B48]MCR2765021.1 M23 family metallopeptidase [Microbacterium sp. zg.B48]